MRLEENIGKQITLGLKHDSAPDALHECTLVGVEGGGVWVDSMDLMTYLDATAPAGGTKHMANIFVPYGNISTIGIHRH